jgi:hypothetical protein
MSDSRSRDRRRKSRSPTYDAALVLLVKSLNTYSATDTGRVMDLLTSTKELWTLCQEAPGRIDAKGISRLAKEINSSLERYKAVPAVFLIDGHIHVRWEPRDSGGARLHSLMAAPNLHEFSKAHESAVVGLLLDAVSKGLLPKIGRCKCGVIFVARSIRSRFCSDDCRIKHWESSEERKAQKRHNAREYYKLHKSGKVK